MIHTTAYANANQTFVLENIDLIVAPDKIQGDWKIQVVFKSGHVATVLYEDGQFHTPREEINTLKCNMMTDYCDLVSALSYYHEKHGLV